MFLEFFYLLRQYGLDVSITEWLTFQEALSKGLHGSSVTGFYHLCRAIVCKSETEYDKFDHAFLDFFEDVFYSADGTLQTELPEAILDYINSAGQKELHLTEEEQSGAGADDRAARRAQQEEAEAADDYVFVESPEAAPFRRSSFDPNIIRVSNRRRPKSGMRVPLWEFRDFREDNVLSIRQFQMAFRRLCPYSDQYGKEEELDIKRTIHDTCQKAGILQVRYKKPRRNTIKVLLLIDSGGTMTPYHPLCSRLFQAASRSNRFKDLKIYYFHNCIDEYLYTNPSLRLKYEVSTRKVLRECDKDYKVIFVGDATMDVNELLYPPAETTPNNLGYSGQDWLKYILSRYRHTVWLTPLLREKGTFIGTWGESYDIITDLFDMYPLTVAGLEQAMKKLMVRD